MGHPEALVTPVDVVIPVYRGWDDASALVARLRGCEDVHVVVVDDASCDGGAAHLSAAFPDVEVLSRATNGGFAAAVNAGLRRTRADVIAVLNSDLTIDCPDLRRLADIASEHPAWIIGPRTEDPDGHDLPTARRPRTLARVLVDFLEMTPWIRRRWARWGDHDVEAASATVPTPTGWLTGSCLVFSRQVLSRVGDLDAGYVMDSEEVDWQTRARAEGLTPVFVPDVRVTHRVGHGATYGSDAWRGRFLSAWRARRRYVRRHRGRVAAVVLRIGLLLVFFANLPIWLSRLVRGPGRTTTLRVVGAYAAVVVDR